MVTNKDKLRMEMKGSTICNFQVKFIPLHQAWENWQSLLSDSCRQHKVKNYPEILSRPELQRVMAIVNTHSNNPASRLVSQFLPPKRCSPLFHQSLINTSLSWGVDLLSKISTFKTTDSDHELLMFYHPYIYCLHLLVQPLAFLAWSSSVDPTISLSTNIPSRAHT